MASRRVQIGEFELDPAAYELRRLGRPVRLERIPMELLLLLVSRRGELVTRTEIIEKLWGSCLHRHQHRDQRGRAESAAGAAGRPGESPVRANGTRQGVSLHCHRGATGGLFPRTYRFRSSCACHRCGGSVHTSISLASLDGDGWFACHRRAASRASVP